MMKAVRILQGLLIITCIVVPTRLYKNIGSKTVTSNDKLVVKNQDTDKDDDKNQLHANGAGEVVLQATKMQMATAANVEVKPSKSFTTINSPASTSTGENKPIKTITANKKSLVGREVEFRKFRIPIVIFCSYRPAYMARLINSMKVLEGLSPDTVCLFACQRTPVVSTQDIKKTKDIINQVKVCKTKTFLTESKKRNAKEYKRQWYNVVKLAFENPGIIQILDVG